MATTLTLEVIQKTIEDARPRKVIMPSDVDEGRKLFVWYASTGNGWRGAIGGVIEREIVERMLGTVEAPTGNHGVWFGTGREAMDELRRVCGEMAREVGEGAAK